jgi:guanylate kinase
LIKALLERVPELELSVSATTRPPRPGEKDGVDYHFLTDEEFDERVQRGDFVEHARYSGRRYGTLRSELDERLQRRHPVVLEIEVQGARQVRRSMPSAIQVFIAPPSLQELRARLIGRGTDHPDEVKRRLDVARGEVQAQPEFQYVVQNDDLDRAATELEGVVRRELQAA